MGRMCAKIPTKTIYTPSIIKTINKIQNAHKRSVHVFHFQFGIEGTLGNAVYSPILLLLGFGQNDANK